MKRAFDLDSAPVAFAWYALATLAMTWPVVANIRSAVPSDLIDPLLNGWILAWGADCVKGLFSGDVGALARFWHPNIFFPEPYAIAYSEHLVAQLALFLPIYAATDDPLIGYNLVFLSTFALSALGAYLLVREFTGDGHAAFFAGLLYGFALCRAQQLGHLQVLSSQWMPFAIYGFRRYFEAGRVRALAGGSAALVLQNLSSGYYLMFFSPVVALYVLYEMADRGLLTDRRTWLRMLAAGAVVAISTLPFVYPYLMVRQLGFEPRPPEEIKRFSADVYSYLTPHEGLWFWGHRLPILRIPEGGLFPGVVTIVFAGVGVGVALRRSWLASRGVALARPGLRPLVWVLSVAAGVVSIWSLLVLWSGPFTNLFRAVWAEAAVLTNVWPVLASLLALLGVTSPRFRALVRGRRGSPALFFASIFALAFYLSLGLVAWTYCHRITDDTLYAWLYGHLPGFDGLRVPSRVAMVGSLCLAVLGGLGASAVAGRWRWGRPAVLLASVLFLAEAAVVPFDVKPVAWAVTEEGMSGVRGRREMAPLYRWVRRLPSGTVVVEFPFGEPEGEARAMLMSVGRWWPLVNGYSGGFPASYRARLEAFRQPLGDSAGTWRTLVASGATAVVVHEWAFAGREGPAFSDWLRSSGAREVAREGPDALFLMSPR